jgi:predicted transcriptional regulator of viral defense system
MQNISIPLPDTLWLYGHLREYANPRAKIAGLERKKELIRLKRGLYITREASGGNFPGGCIANRLYGPSYVSFAYALWLYNFIPEYVPHVTSATRGKHRTKRFVTPVGVFFYRDVPAAVFHRDITFRTESGVRYLIATPEKALCDELSVAGTIRSVHAMEQLLFDNLRIDRESLLKMDPEVIGTLAPLYKSTAVESFDRFLRSMKSEKRA